jgi:phage-related protein
MAAEFSEIIETLTEEDLRSALDYVRFLSVSRKKKAKATLKQIQGLFAEDKGWKNEQEMLADMANFRRTRTA